ncbi:MAG: hypothetical protein AB1405_10860 [Bdellovibrionota bacterium]
MARSSKLFRRTLGAAVIVTAVAGVAIHAGARAKAPLALDGEWSARLYEDGGDGLVEETRRFDVQFSEGSFVAQGDDGIVGQGRFELARGGVLRLSAETGEDVYSVLPLSNEVISVYREGSQKAIYLVRK